MCCDSVRPWLGAYFDGEVSPVRGWQVRRHLRRCAACAREVEGLSQLQSTLLRVDVARVPPALATDAAIRPRPSRLRRAAAAGALVLAAGAVFLLDRSRSYGDPLERAISTLAKAPAWGSSHVVVRNRAGERVREQWVILPDTLRDERYEQGRLIEWTVQVAGHTTRYRAEQKLAVEGTGLLYRPEPHGVGAFHGPINALRHLRTAAEKIGGVIVTERASTTPQGRRLRVYTIAIDVSRHYPQDADLRGVATLRHVVSVDRATGRLVRWEDAQSGLTYEVDRYDEPVPVAKFDWHPPAGTRIVQFQDWWAARSSRSIGADAAVAHGVTVHALDAAANGDLWLTVSRKAEGKEARLTDWPSRGMVAQDERGRAYIQFVTLGNANWPKNAALLGFTPVKPRSTREPRPRRLTVRLLPEHRPHQRPIDHRHELVTIRGLRVPEPATWEAPPLNVLDVLREKAEKADWMSERRSRARRAYRADNPCGAFG